MNAPMPTPTRKAKAGIPTPMPNFAPVERPPFEDVVPRGLEVEGEEKLVSSTEFDAPAVAVAPLEGTELGRAVDVVTADTEAGNTTGIALLTSAGSATYHSGVRPSLRDDMRSDDSASGFVIASERTDGGIAVARTDSTEEERAESRVSSRFAFSMCDARIESMQWKRSKNCMKHCER
ncbi:hypothetical protein K469DRAFT_704805 [Zopfia rhizophila CBS 207.26]|uniref:Uncharacterized protein n=1 Tax=Zopfia rhizophila CBS 207.26 TaxID=1314779 RepID=A0A6A6E9M8_9PEZI|nr:hypothetical protein K469DRAFT_704805 [Zopfia rhizophila CBS 207.26]